MAAYQDSGSSGLITGYDFAIIYGFATSGTYRGAVVWSYGTDSYADNVTWAGAGTITPFLSYINSGYHIRLFFVENPPTSTADIEVNWLSAQGGLGAIVQSASGSVGPISVKDFDHVDDDTSTQQSVHGSVDTAVGDVVFGFAQQGNVGSTPDFVAYGTEDVRVNDNNGVYEGIGAVSKAGSAGSTAIGIGDANNAAAWIFAFVSLTETAPSGASADLTGTNISTGQGSVTSSATKGLTGQAATIGQGAVSPAAAITVSGVSSSVSQGSVAPAVSVSLTGHDVTVSLGNISPNDTEQENLTGQDVGVGLGTVAPQTAKALSGHAIGIGQGNVAPSVSITLTGHGISCHVGDLDVADEANHALVIDLGSVRPGMSITLTGHSIGISLGNLDPDSNQPIGDQLSASLFVYPLLGGGPIIRPAVGGKPKINLH